MLGLEFNRLKRMSQVAEPSASKRRVRPPAFVELIAPQAIGERGKLRIELNGTSDELASVSRVLWEMLA